jgi:hypothetical protein
MLPVAVSRALVVAAVLAAEYAVWEIVGGAHLARSVLQISYPGYPPIYFGLTYAAALVVASRRPRFRALPLLLGSAGVGAVISAIAVILATLLAPYGVSRIAKTFDLGIVSAVAAFSAGIFSLGGWLLAAILLPIAARLPGARDPRQSSGAD